MNEFVSSFRRLFVLPPVEALARVRGAVGRRLQAKRERFRDQHGSTYLSHTPEGQFVRIFSVQSEDIPEDLIQTLDLICTDHCAHRFDLLGAGPTVVRRTDKVDAGGLWLKRLVRPANTSESQRIWRLIGEGPFAHGEYAPIDWNMDFKSGYRWPEATHWRDIQIAPSPGVDIKVPWELSRLQHLPQLAIAAVLKASQGNGDAAHGYALEVRAQILDFIATTPPRCGVDWASPMETAIRLANMLAATDILQDADIEYDGPFLQVLKRSVFEHIHHVLANLEWSEDARGNHYLANILGVLVAGCCIRNNGEADAWLVFAAGQMGIETKRQFLRDGGNFEASTSYHRLSGEMALFGAGLICGAWQTRRQAFEDADAGALNVRPPIAFLPIESATPLDDEWHAALRKLSEFTYALQKPNGCVLQIGDNDSGRFFIFHPIMRSGGGRDHLVHIALLGQANAVLDRDDLTDDHAVLDTTILKHILSDGATCGADTPPFSGAISNVGEHQALHDMAAKIQGLAPGHWTETVFKVDSEIPSPLVAEGFPDFGLYVLKGPGTYLAVRCHSPNLGASMGHAHDDNLGLELVLEGQERVVDPGSAIYTADPTKRNLYRSAASHFVPRAEGKEAAREGEGLFSYFLTGQGECCYFGPHGFAGRIETDAWCVLRAVIVEAHCVRVLDGSVKQPLAAHKVFQTDHGVSLGYGEETKSPLCLL